MSVVAQRDGVRVVAFNKCGHTSIINMFLTPADKELVRGAAPAIRISNAAPVLQEVYRGTAMDAQHWPEPELTITFFRNPLQRALSAYEHFIIRTLDEVDGVPTLGRESFTKLGFTVGMSWYEFCAHLGKIDLSADDHLKSQAQSFTEVFTGGEVYGGQLEQLSTTWPLIVDQYGLDCTKEVPQYNEAKYDRERMLSTAAYTRFDQLYGADRRYWEAAHFETGTKISPVCH